MPQQAENINNVTLNGALHEGNKLASTAMPSAQDQAPELLSPEQLCALSSRLLAVSKAKAVKAVAQFNSL